MTNSYWYTVVNGSSQTNNSPHILRSEKDELLVQVVSRMLQHQPHADSTIHHILHIKDKIIKFYTCYIYRAGKLGWAG